MKEKKEKELKDSKIKVQTALDSAIKTFDPEQRRIKELIIQQETTNQNSLLLLQINESIESVKSSIDTLTTTLQEILNAPK